MTIGVEAACSIVVAAPTPFLANGAADLAGFRSNIDRWFAAGVDGVLALGSTGEVVHLDEDEAAFVLAAAREAVPSDRFLIAGTGRPTTAATIRATARAAEIGADAALVITPHFFKTEMTAAALAKFYRDVADASRIPVYLYSVPGTTGVVIPADLVAELSRHRNIAGLKDSSGDIAGMFERVESSPPDFRVLNGSPRAVLPALAAGAKGSILAMASVAPEIAVEAHRAFARGDMDSARRAASVLAALARGLAPVGIPGLKAAMTSRGYAGGICRQPLAFDFKAMRDVENALAAAGLGTDS